jgi:REP element-mobilizing transposase RayT
MPQSFASLTCHVIFSTKNREPLIVNNLRDRLYSYIGGVCRNSGDCLLFAGGMADHVHLLVSLGKGTAIADCVRDIKSNSSGWVHETFPHLRGFAWQAGYGAFTVSYSNIARVKGYIERQAEHHRVRTFQEELIAFLKRHHIEYDERYLWD